MVTSTRGFPRFLPTLTEVVPVPPKPVEPPVDLVALAAERRAELAQRMRLQLHQALDGRMQDMVAAAMLEQVDVIGDRLRVQMEDMVRDSLDAITLRMQTDLEILVREAVDVVVADDGAPVPKEETGETPAS